ncbi:tetratricopeptide repeat protein [Photobacterium sp. TY1-4]|uniref:tetratricopeptide repeat protein n=1 Tax=Photobacterium sp. TY1-4 TaxID=2899122 RepID=UPI0021BF7073|nr:tetratricopeptide repeat protein [Photobacterium sp. TY1-4]UXI04532.1 sel1 repeat family protein [Photobacterium sp. TY1-4]
MQSVNRLIRSGVLIGLSTLLTACAVSYEDAEAKFRQGEITEAREAWTDLAEEGDVRAKYRLYTSAYEKSDQDIAALKQAADEGYPPAMYDYAMRLIVSEEYTRGITYLENAKAQGSEKASAYLKDNAKLVKYWPEAEQGDRDAMNRLGDHYYDSDDGEKAYHWYKQSADLKSPYAHFRIGVMYYFGKYLEQDSAKGAALFQQAADKGLSMAQHNLCILYRDGDGVIKDKQVARQWCEKAAAQGNVAAQSELGRFYLFGFGGEKDYRKAFSLFEPIAEKNLIAAYHLGYMYYKGLYVKQDYRRAAPWFEKASARELDTLSAYYLGMMAYHGYGQDKDRKSALKWFLLSAERGDKDAQNYVAHMYRYGQGTRKDLKTAFQWSKKAAEQGEVESIYQVGNAYLNGEGVVKNLRRAKDYLLKAANKGNVDAQFNLGYEYSKSGRFKQDNDLFYKWTKKAAENNHEIAQSNLAVAYNNGWGVNKNYAWAAYWGAKAIENGNDTPKTRMPNYLAKLKKWQTTKKTPLYNKASADTPVVESLGKATYVYSLSAARDGWIEVVDGDQFKLGYVKLDSISRYQPLPARRASSSGNLYPAQPAKRPGVVSCNTRCVNATCYRTYDDGRNVKFQAQRKYNALSGQFEWDSGGC